jgi:UDP-glucose:(heptosyl)LPS alpha-1,3-glucosyltransferase
MASRSAAMAVIPGELRNSGRTMRIAFVMHDYRRAGVGQTRYVKELAERFSREHEVHVFANQVESDGGDNIHFHHVPAWRMNLLTTVLSFAATSTLKIGKGFDIIHSQGFCGFYGNVFTAHICNRAWNLALQKFEGGVTGRERIFNTFATALEYTAYRPPRKCAVIAVSERVANDLRKYYHCPAPIQVIYHGVNLELFSPANRGRLRAEARRRLNLPETEFVFLFAGQLRKGVARSIQALARVPRGRLVCVSPSPAEPYRALVKQLGLEERVQFCDFSDRVESFYAAADALLLPTPYDSFGMVVTEAMASGVPVVVSREAGASELIEHGVNGLLLEDVTDQAELAGWMESLEQDREGAVRLGCEGRRTVERLSWDAVARETMQVYEDLVAQQPSKS